MDIKVNFNACIKLFIIVWHLLPFVNGACTWPSAFASSQWQDSSRGLLTFSTTTMTGWTFSPTTGVNMSSWDCVSVNAYSTDGQIIMITSTSFKLFASTDYYAYMCITVTQVTSASYRYYINNEKQSAIFNERLFIYPVNTLTDSGTICSNNGASDGEYQLLIKEGAQSSAKIDCPWYFLGNYGYTHTTPQNVVTCNKTTSKMSMCTNTQQITLNYTTCPTKVAYSVSNTVWCVANVQSGGTNYVMLYNGNDAATDINNTSTFRFTCMAVSSDVSSASLSPKYCQSGQTATSYPMTPAGLPIGALLSFASPSATCSTCPVLPAPAYGNVTVSTTDSVTSALYACAQNYTLWGSSTRTCQADRTWTSTMPSCSCATPPTPSYGTVTVNSNGSVATYRCNVGYTLDGLSSRNCLTASASWEGADPKCVKCASLLSVAGQTPSPITNGTITTVTFVCVAGYTLVGTTSMTCASDGTWDSVQPSCVSCQLLNNPSSGSVALSTTGSVTTATYSCMSGYTLQGSTTRTCQQNGTWTNSEPKCLCNQPSSLNNGAVVANGILANYTCNVGFTLTGQASRTCQTDGTGWSDKDPSCTKCNPLSAVAGGSYSLTTTGTVTSARYTCSVGYSLDGVTTITCQSDGFWSSPSPTCIQCPTLTQPSSGTVTLTTSGTKTSATYTCASGYNLNGNAIRLCNSDGTWSLLAPTCTCQSPVIPSNGAVVDNGVIATYTCNQGYSLNGASTRTCASDGSGWSSSNPSCSTCATLNTPTGGTVTLSTDGVNTKATFKCNSGYTLSGMTTITCRSDGSWDFTAPTCNKCPDLSNPPSGTLTLTTNGSTTIASFSCATGYYLSGPFSITCGADGRWSNNAPTCKCNFPAQPLNGGVTVAGTGQVATYTCATGYSLNGLSARSCMTDGTGWQGADPVCTVCQTLSNPASGTFSIDSNGTHTTALYRCDVGTTMNGSRILACKADGTWSSAPPTCVACPTLSDPDSGTVALSTGGTTTTATFSCVTGYTINSTGILTCLSTGKWDIVAPHCVCQAPPSIVNGQLTISADLRTASYTCNVGYVLVGSSSRSCQTKGAGWNGIAPVCDGGDANTGASTKDTADWNIPIAAVVIVILIVIALVVISAIFIHMYCRLKNERPSRVASTVSRTPENPEVLCPSLTFPASGSISVSTNGTQTVAIYACAAGYDLNGNSTRACNPDGTWTQAAPNCTCTSPAPPANGQVTANGVTATYRCNQGYSLNGLSTQTCGASGSGWSGSQPTCSTCVTLVTPTGGSVNLSTDGINTKVSYTCSLGYTLSGTSSITCRSDGTWDFTPPTCVQCPSLANPSSGTVTLSTNGFTTTASFSCGTGYFLSGAFTLTCNTGGTWSNNPPTCKCNFPAQPNNGQVTLSNSGTVASYRCNTGYTLAGLSSRTCQADGSGWEGSDPVCQMCNQLTNPVSGSFTLSTNGTQTRVQYRCNVGTTLHGDISSVCKSDGTWENPSPACVQCKQLNNPDSGSVALSTDGITTTATFSCVSGYTLNSTGVLACTISGNWDISSPFCICQSPPLVAHSELDISSDLRTATYTCNVGYVLVGSATRTCQANGTGWDGISPICDSPAVGESTDGSVWNVPIAAIVILIVVIVALVVVSIITTYMLCRMRKEKSGQVSPTVPGSVPGSREPSETCMTLPNPVGGSFSLTSNGLTTKANYSCVSGYTLVGSKDRYCQQNKSYTPAAPTCVQCAILNSLGSGNVYITTDGFMSTASYSCVSGYRLVGTSKRTCLADGSWNGTAPVCECGSPSSPLNGALMANGKTANYSCDTGYTLLGTQMRTCNSDGTGWSSYDPQCIFCQTLQDPLGGLFTLDTSGTQTFALFYCEVGYTLKGIYKVYCLFTGNWDTIPSCTRCNTLPAPASSTITTTSTGRVTSAKYTCAAGYDLNGYNVRTCLPDGSWDLTEPNCTCQAPPTIQHGTVSTNGVLATYTCNVGFSLEGVSTRACATDGSGWTSTNPKCNPCKTLSVLTGGTVSMVTDGQETKALYKCDVGYTLNGRDNITCRSDGTWDFSQPLCALCATLASPGSGNVSLTTDSKTTQATFTCVSGYYVSGPLTIKCQTNGQWSSNPPSCKCISPVAPGNGSVSVSDTAQGPVANYLCQLGYSINGLVSRLCQNDGSGWKGADPTCKLCSFISTPSELLFTISTNGSMTTGKYACALNYTLSGEHAHQCLGNGSWNNPKPTCVQCSAIHAPLSGTLKLSTDGLQTSATFSCVSGYDLNSTSVLTCKTDGRWDLPSPFCVCQPPPAVVNGDFDLLDDGMIANFSCDENYELVGPIERYCLMDGAGWNGTQPRCDLIKLPPVVAESTDKTILAIPVGGFIALVVLVLLLLVALAIVAVCNYMRYRKERHRVGTTLDSGRKPEEEDRRFNFESPDLENGKALLISKSMDPKTAFDVKALREKSSFSNLNKKKMNSAAADEKDVLSSQSADVEDNKDSLSQDSLLSVTNHVTRDHVTSNGTLPHIPFSAVRLPKLPPMVPKPITESTTTTTKVSKLRRKRRKIDRKEPNSQQQQQNQPVPDSETSLPERSTDSRNSTPIEIKMKGTLTPDILSTEHFEYLQPVFCHEAQTPTSSRPTTGTSRATVRTAKSAPGALLDHSIDVSESNM